jgi:squalene-hopene/tetraprenyl-beta-curcumene cyclase
MSACSRTHAKDAKASWDPKAAASYLDQREVTWRGWIPARQDHETFCVACHTAIPYALARPALRKTLAEGGLSVDERKLIDNVTKRVQLWSEIGPFYGSENAARSRGTESVLNALILASYDAQNGHLSDTTRAALRDVWALQKMEGDDRGTWSWLQFGMEPFEAKDSPYYGACLAAIAVGLAPEDYRSAPEIQENLRMLREYLDRKYETQSTINHAVLLWASTKLPGLIQPALQKSIINELWQDQHADGGWDLPSLVFPRDGSLHSFVRKRVRADFTLQESRSDGYATALITFSLEQAGIPTTDPRLSQGLSWLARNQDKAEGLWPSTSVNLHRDPSSNIGHFMDDAATGFAVLALSGDTPSVKSENTVSKPQLASRDTEKW